MKPYEFRRVYHPKLERIVYKHEGNGLIVDSIFKPLRKVMTSAASSVLGHLVKPITKKSGVENAGDKMEKKLPRKVVI